MSLFVVVVVVVVLVLVLVAAVAVFAADEKNQRSSLEPHQAWSRDLCPWLLPADR